MHKFELGELVATRSIADKIAADADFKAFIENSFKRYISCDWGDTYDEDKELNDNAVQDGNSRILASYINPATKEKIWIITEWDHSVTTVLYPSEY